MKIKDLLERLQTDEALLKQYVDDPEGTATAAGLSPGQARTLVSRDLKKIKKALDEESPGLNVLCIVMVA